MLDIWFYLGISVLIAGVYSSWNANSIQETEQAALLPFADDPDVASRITQETGITFDRIVKGIEQNSEAPVTGNVDSFIA